MATLFDVPFLRSALLVGGLCFLLAGCGSGESYETVTSEDADRAEAHADEHDHHHEAPHGGHLIELGEHQYNAEVLLEGGQLVVYLLDAHAENPVAIDAESIAFLVEEGESITLQAEAQDGDADGTSSRFAAAVEFDDLEEIHGSVQATIKETEYTGALSHDHDDDHDHAEDHEHDEHDHD